MLVPLMEYLDVYLSKDYKIVYHFSDIKKYFTLSVTDDKLSSILTKYYNKSGDKIAIRGIAQSIIDIYEYYKNLRIVLLAYFLYMLLLY